MEDHDKAAGEEATSFDELLRGSDAYRSAFDQRVQEALQTAKTEWEREAAAERERTRAEAEEHAMAAAQAAYRDRLQELETQKAELARRDREARTARALAERGLPESFSPWLTGADAEESEARIASFDAAFRRAVQADLAVRMAGTPPVDPAPAPCWDGETLRGMTPREINAHWAEIQTTLEKKG